MCTATESVILRLCVSVRALPYPETERRQNLTFPFEAVSLVIYPPHPTVPDTVKMRQVAASCPYFIP